VALQRLGGTRVAKSCLPGHRLIICLMQNREVHSPLPTRFRHFRLRACSCHARCVFLKLFAMRKVLLTRLGNISARIVVQEVDKSPPNTRRSRPSPNNELPLCATLCTLGGGELHQRRSRIATMLRPPTPQDLGRLGSAGYRFARGD
jgi:hypothetical protein